MDKSNILGSKLHIQIDESIAYLVLVAVLLLIMILGCARYFKKSGLGVTKFKTRLNAKEICVGCVILAIVIVVNLWLFFSPCDKNTYIKEDAPLNQNILKENFNSAEVTAYFYPPSKALDGFMEEQPECLDIEFKRSLKSSDPFTVSSNLRDIRVEALRLSESEYPIAKSCFLDMETESEEDIINNKWFNFCGSSVWLAKYNVHFYVSRVVYSNAKHRNNPTISLVYAQIFDREWNEVFDFVFKRSDKTLSFPRFMQIDIDQNPKGKTEVMGPEDPRVLVHKYTNGDGEEDEEPIIIFNMRSTEIKWFRAIHMFRPFFNDKTIRFSIKNLKPRWREKNWAPFFDESDDGKINFVYSFSPLRILKCDLKDGICDKESGPDFIDIKQSDDIGALRGGTNLIPISNEVLPKELQKKKYWFGIARSHIKDCGCLNEIYRPHAFVISKDLNGSNFTIEYISSFVDFNVLVEPWTKSKTTCEDGKSVLIPNSISHWDFVYSNNKVVEDIMTITFSEADRTNKNIFVKGFLEQLLVALIKVNENDSESDLLNDGTYINFLARCSTSLSDTYCQSMEKIQNWRGI